MNATRTRAADLASEIWKLLCAGHDVRLESGPHWATLRMCPGDHLGNHGFWIDVSHGHPGFEAVYSQGVCFPNRPMSAVEDLAWGIALSEAA